jgi:hypothetical protein
MNWKTLLTPQRVGEGAFSLWLIVWGIYKKEVQDGLRAGFKWGYNWVRGYFTRPPAQRVSDDEVATIVASVIGSDMEALTTLLYLLEREYAADRVTITTYAEQPDGSALATCVVEVRQAEMKSVLHLRQSPIGKELWRQIKRITTLDHRVRSVLDARTEESAALRVALLNSGVWSAYYQAMPEPEEEEQEEHPKITLLALSWHTRHELSPEQLRALLQSGVVCATLLLSMDRLKKISTK